MIPFKFFKGYVYSDEVLPFVYGRRAGRTIAQDHLVSIESMAQSVRMRWIEAHAHNFHYRIYTHHSHQEIESIVLQNILPFLFEPNNPANRQRLLNMLSARFHRAEILNS